MAIGSMANARARNTINERGVEQSCQPTRAGGKRVLVTGHAGFIGYHVTKQLKERGDGVAGMDNFNAYYPVKLKEARAEELRKRGVETVRGDVADAKLLGKALGACAPTHVLHLAAQAGVRHARRDPHSYVHANVEAFVTLEEAIVRMTPMPIFVYASSSSVYGANEKVPFSEGDRTDAPASLYAATKKAGEALAHTYASIFGLSSTGLRFFTVYGSFGRPDMAYFSFARDISAGNTITLYQGPGGSELRRDFTHISDVAKGTIAALDRAPPSSSPPGHFRLYNLGNTNPVPVSRLISHLESLLGKRAIVKRAPLPNTGDVLATHADVSRARGELGYEPLTPLEDGLKEFVDWFQSFFGDPAHSFDYSPP